MTKVTRTDGDSPSAELVREAQAEVEVTDSTGRVIKLRKPGVLAQFKLVKAMGAESAENTTLMSMYMPLLYVSQIGEDAVFPPTSEREIEGTITRLDEAGLDAVMRGVQEHFTTQSPDEVKAAIKK